MLKITFMGAGSTVFARNVLGDCMCTPALCEAEIALYDIDEQRLKDSEIILRAINKNVNQDRATIRTYLGVENRKAALIRLESAASCGLCAPFLSWKNLPGIWKKFALMRSSLITPIPWPC